jgi:hypothetical protein
MKEYDFRIASSIDSRGKSSRIDPTLKNQFLQVSFDTSGSRMSLKPQFQNHNTMLQTLLRIKYCLNYYFLKSSPLLSFQPIIHHLTKLVQNVCNYDELTWIKGYHRCVSHQLTALQFNLKIHHHHINPH